MPGMVGRQYSIHAMKILFLHGWQSTPGGRKPTYLKEHGYTVLNPALLDDDFDGALYVLGDCAAAATTCYGGSDDGARQATCREPI